MQIRPIHHWLEDRVRTHIFLCMLAYHVEWHMRQFWRELLFADEDLEAKSDRDGRVQRSLQALEKIAEQTLEGASFSEPSPRRVHQRTKSCW
jgi:transposase